jgi:UDP-N-acetylmuramate--alanine ligase
MKDKEPFSLSTFQSVYFIGIGGIGMSALARYMHAKGWIVGGYDKTSTHLTVQLEAEGMFVHYEDDINQVPSPFLNAETALIVYTPAIPHEMKELVYFQEHAFKVVKRSELLGLITKHSKALGVAGTHGKTTTSTMLAHVLNQSSLSCDAFLGGISSNFQSNLLIKKDAKYTVIEADEFDRSFLNLHPYASIITSIDPDHLDIYNDPTTFHEGFQSYADLTHSNGFLVVKEGLPIQSKVPTLRYGLNCPEAAYSATQTRFVDGEFSMDIQASNRSIEHVVLGIPGIHNAENALAVWAMCEQLGLTEKEIRAGLSSFLGVKRRFEYIFKSERIIFIDDYAHHPTEINALLQAVREMYPNKPITGIFQPHLFSRTRDFFTGFVDALEKLNKLILLPIYPAREKPITDINSEKLFEAIQLKEKYLMSPTEAIEASEHIEGILLTIGAGDIDRIVEPIKRRLT